MPQKCLMIQVAGDAEAQCIFFPGVRHRLMP